MRIAVIGWGSLLWDERKGDQALEIKLDYQGEGVEKGWYSDGPQLPIEFARISGSKPGSDSKCKRLTLVIYPHVPDVKTLWALSIKEELAAAALNLCAREGTSREMIGTFRKGGSATNAITQVIADWLDKHSELDAAVWTDLPPNFEEKQGKHFTPQSAVKYLKKLHSKGYHQDAVEYIRRAPKQIQTSARPLLEGAIERFQPPQLSNEK